MSTGLFQPSVDRILEKIGAHHCWLHVIRIVKRSIDKIGTNYPTVGGVRIQGRIRILMMSAMHRHPPDWRSVERHISAGNDEIFDSFGTAKGAVRQKSVESNSHTECVPKVE